MPSIKEAIRRRREGSNVEIERFKDDLRQLDLSIKDKMVLLEELNESKLQKFVASVEEKVMNRLEEYVSKTTKFLYDNKLKGETGPMGPVGPQGPAGRDGKDGKDGVNGKNGKDGVVGPVGPAGRDGKDGKDGKDGVSVSKAEILDEIMPLINQIKLESKKAIRSMSPQKGGGGGGMGNPTTFSFDCDGATTEFTLSTKVAANGMAIWAYINGQWIQPGVHFNVSGKTLTTTFTPENGDKLEGFFIRT